MFNLFKTRSYTRFVVITSARTGSNLLINTLRGHPAMTVYGEILRGGVDDSVKTAVRQSPASYFNRHIFNAQNRGTRAVGFKIFYHHPAWDRSDRVWQYLDTLDNLHVIHLTREDLLRSYVSKLIAKKTDNWKQSGASRQEQDKSVTVDLAGCVAHFERITQAQRDTERRFGHKPYLRLTFESLTADFDSHVDLVQRFLGVDALSLEAKTVRQNPEALQSLVENYAEVRHALASTPWAGFVS